jgi:serine/threonine protein kinase/hemoglobin-like flavoprotein/class 3 adenylate cyclase
MTDPLQIGKYRLIERIGEGAMGEVFHAHDPILDRRLALKIITGGDDDRRLRFRREAQSAARLSHPNIVVVYDFGEDDGRFFMAMELLEGHDLKWMIGTQGFPNLGMKLRAMQQICDAVSFAHSMNIIHRDLKPANIFILPSGQAKILDFGLAHISQSDMTGTGAILGTPNYMAPEQIRGIRIDARADVFALGAVFYELLSGRKAFHADSLHGVMYKVLQETPEPIRNLNSDVPQGVADVVTRALQKNPDARFQTASELRDAIAALRGPATEIMSMSPSLSGSASSSASKKDVSLVSGTVVLGESLAGARSIAAPARVTFAGEPGGPIDVDIAPGQTLLAASLACGIPHTHECGGHARCSTCRVLVISGGENLSPRDSAELRLSRQLGLSDDIRLACQTKATGAATFRRLIIDADDVRLSRLGRDTGGSGSEMPLAVLHVSVREFGSLVRRHLPYDIVHLLNRYYLQLGDAVLANGGVIDRYTTGGLMALFGTAGEDAKTKCTNAVRAALRIQRRMIPFNDYLREHFSMRFTIDIGLHYGRMIVGRIGHPDHAKVTAIGDGSTVAGSIAASNGDHEPGILATEELINVIEGDIRTGHVNHLVPTGLQREYTVYEVVDFAKPDTHYLVQTSFEKVSVQRERASELFYQHLFEIAPHVRPMFANTNMQTQGAMLMNMIAAAVNGLDRLDELKPVLQDLGRRHIAYGVRVEHYAAVELCLLHTLETILEKDFTLDVKLAWTQIFNFIAQTMIEASLTEN